MLGDVAARAVFLDGGPGGAYRLRSIGFGVCLGNLFGLCFASCGRKCRGLFINVPKYFISLKDSFNNYSEYIDHIKKNVLTADLVVWDDIATKGFTEFETESLLNIINNRVDAGKANIYTSNLAGEELKQAMGDRLYSRVANMSEMIIFKSTDKRGILT